MSDLAEKMVQLRMQHRNGQSPHVSDTVRSRLLVLRSALVAQQEVMAVSIALVDDLLRPQEAGGGTEAAAEGVGPCLHVGASLVETMGGHAVVVCDNCGQLDDDGRPVE